MEVIGTQWRFGGSFKMWEFMRKMCGGFGWVVAQNGDSVAHLAELWLKMEICWLIWKSCGSNGDMVAHSKEGAAPPEDSGGSFGELGPIKEICWLIDRCDGLIVGHRQLEI